VSKGRQFRQMGFNQGMMVPPPPQSPCLPSLSKSLAFFLVFARR